MIDNEENDTLTYNMKSIFIFRPDLSNGLTGNEIITTVHGLIMVCSLFIVHIVHCFAKFQIAVICPKSPLASNYGEIGSGCLLKLLMVIRISLF